jgi:hypothetical protein
MACHFAIDRIDDGPSGAARGITDGRPGGVANAALDLTTILIPGFNRQLAVACLRATR